MGRRWCRRYSKQADLTWRCGTLGGSDQDGMRLVVDAEYYVSVGHDGEDQRRVALADKADPGVAAVGGS